jgi:hypothetical protein
MQTAASADGETRSFYAQTVSSAGRNVWKIVIGRTHNMKWNTANPHVDYRGFLYDDLL